MTIDTIREKAEAFDRRTRRQDLASIAVFSFIIMANAVTAAFQASMTEKIGDLLTVAAALYVLTFYLRVREPSPAALGATPSLDFYRDQILRRQAMVGRFWKVVRGSSGSIDGKRANCQPSWMSSIGSPKTRFVRLPAA